MLTNTRSRVTNVAHSTPTIYLEQLSASDGRQQLHELLEGRHAHGQPWKGWTGVIAMDPNRKLSGPRAASAAAFRGAAASATMIHASPMGSKP